MGQLGVIALAEQRTESREQTAEGRKTYTEIDEDSSTTPQDVMG